MIIIKAINIQAKILTEIAYSAKKYWKYPEEYFELWKDELTVSSAYIQNNMVYTANIKDQVVGFYSIVENDKNIWIGDVYIQKGYWMEHIFIKPEFHHKGIGTSLIKHAKMICKQENIKELLIFVDPYAKGFYEKIGAKFLYESKSSIPGRKIPVYLLLSD